MPEEKPKQKKVNVYAIIGVALLIVAVIVGFLIWVKVITLKQVLVLVIVLVVIALIVGVIYYVNHKKTRKLIEAKVTQVELKDDFFYIQKMREYLINKGIQPKTMEISNRVVGKNNDNVMFGKYQNYWHPYEAGWIIINCNTMRISEALTKEDLKETIFGVATKPRVFIQKTRKTPTPYGEMEETEETPMEEIEKEQQETKEKEIRKI